MKYTQDEREEAANLCNARASLHASLSYAEKQRLAADRVGWWISGWRSDSVFWFSRRVHELSDLAFAQVVEPEDSLMSDWLEAEALIREGWSPSGGAQPRG